MRQRGIQLTKEQISFLCEFSDLNFIFDDISWRFYSPEYILNNYQPLVAGTSNRNVKVVGNNIFECGCTEGSGIYLCDNGLLATGVNLLGRTTMECINHLCNFIPDNSKWIDEEDDQ